MNHLELLNVVLALRFKQPGCPPLLADHGYLVQGIAVTIPLTGGRKICPDVLAPAFERDTTLLVEVKGSKSIDLDQIGRMESLTPEQLRDFAYVSVRDLGRHRIAPVLVCNTSDYEAVCDAVEGRVVTVVGCDGQSFRVGGAPLPDRERPGVG